jgi:pyruvate, water dikinase
MNMNKNIIHFESLGINDIDQVGGKNASLGEMISHLNKTRVRVPGGFATTAYAYRNFLAQNGLDNRIDSALSNLDVDDVKKLAKVGQSIRQWIIETPFPDDLETDICSAYQTMAVRESADFSVAVRSSATAEDLPDASFAGQQETFLNVTGIDEILLTVKQVFASLFNDRAISYRVHQGFAHGQIALSAGIQRMVRSDIGSSGVMFTLDTESGFTDVVFITTSYGLGEMIVQGAVNPDEFYVYKPNLDTGKPAILRRSLGKKALKMIFDDVERVATVAVDPEQAARFSLQDEEVEKLAKLAVIIERHSGESLFLRKLVLGIPAQASGKNLTRPLMPSAPRPSCVRAAPPHHRKLGAGYAALPQMTRRGFSYAYFVSPLALSHDG